MKRDRKQILTELLVYKAQAGDERAFCDLHDLWSVDILKLATSVLSNSHAAEETAQVTWVAMARSIRKLEDPARFRAWAFGILRRKCVDLMRSEKRRREREAKYQEQTERESEARKSARSELSIELAELIHKMDTEGRLLIHLYYEMGLSTSELAESFGVAVGTVKSRLFTLRETLRNQLERKMK